MNDVIENFSNLIRRLLFKLKGLKVGYQNECFYSLDEINNLQSYKNKNLIKFVFNKAKQARKNNLYEQDGKISEKPRPNKFFINFLLYDYINEIELNRKIKVLDYGGSFGNSFFSLQSYLNLKFDWYVYDQKDKIKLANKEKLFNPINFIYQHQVKKNNFYDMILFSTSLQYFDDPMFTLKTLLNSSKIILISNVILTNFKKNYFRIERPDPTIYNFSYPCWFLSKSILKQKLKKNFHIEFFKKENVYPLRNNENYYDLKLIKKT